MTMQSLSDIRTFQSLSTEARGELAEAVAARLGPEFAPEEQEEGVCALLFRHLTSGLVLALVPGGGFEMGLTGADIAELRDFLQSEDLMREALEGATSEMLPAHRVEVAPFLIARELLGAAEVERLSNLRFKGPNCSMLHRDEARDLARSLGFRLVSEAELEWIQREGGTCSFTLDAARKLEEIGRDSTLLTSRLGIVELFDEQWVEDDYHATYDGAPSTSSPWMDGDPAGVFRGGSGPEYVDEPQQVVGILAAMRGNGAMAQARIRLALDIASLL
ncbi:MAG: hypothetical protein R3B70_49115 [Polyangiaceae bacterium]